jgi:galactokinase
VLPALAARFREQSGRAPTAAARAPGRINLIGEHTDYNEGFVLPCAIDRDTFAVAAARADGVFTGVSREDPAAVLIDGERDERPGGWGAYLYGVVRALADRGHRLPGADLAVASEVPVGAGLSSSAALCVALVTALDALFELQLDWEARAAIAHRAENVYAGIPVGIMDSLASAGGRQARALFIDCRDVRCTLVALPDALRILVADSGVKRRLAAGAYGDRRAECEQALRIACEAGIGPADARALRDFEVGDLPALERALPATLFRRARHVVRENARVQATVAALSEGELPEVGAQLRAGMASLRDDFEVSIPELDALCEIADALPGVYGSRLCGAGFGGCAIHLVDADAASATERALAQGFERRFGRRPPIYAVQAGPGATSLEL